MSEQETKHKWTAVKDVPVEEIVQLRQEGMSYKAIAKHFNLEDKHAHLKLGQKVYRSVVREKEGRPQREKTLRKAQEPEQPRKEDLTVKSPKPVAKPSIPKPKDKGEDKGDKTTDKKCPECKSGLQLVSFGGRLIYHCEKCGENYID